MSTPSPTLKFVLRDEGGSNWVSGVTWQGHVQKVKWLEERYGWCDKKIMEFESRIKALERPLKKTQILEIIRRQTAPRTIRFFISRIADFDWVAWSELLSENKIEKVLHGRLAL